MGTTDIPAAEEKGPTARTTVTSFRVIEALKERGTAGVSELADELDLAKGTIHKHLNTLRRLDYVIKDGHAYRLSVSFLGLGTSARACLPIAETVVEPLEDLASTTEETVGLMIPEHGHGIYILRESAQKQMEMAAREGDRLPMHATAGGKAILSYTPPEERERILDYRGLPKLTDNTITDRDALEDELQLTRDRRMAYDRSEYREGWHCIAHPVTNSDGRAIGAITVSGPAARMKEKDASTYFASIIGSTANSVQNAFALDR
ncbi:transcriptional regulator, IclR family (plasmid) [Haloterrigena turkmenica DSM 5511]|uniref:Transcriptional regulator, IclR family n=1 Tax=Haloterrigena turkmenica (strain ATCC 51198 / DSM 5511 / JCM 9101 / NCIMB 13204 / VKM B-1734 / 4k) TaxID=543526 RepID=D2S235_HALTV|nr:IclR family transcriptional regulator [Haloterrigena turkmenica]ADB63432.1 transcriptional regulator, IclR family [Haloterrigena turkmenica DSM 5511]